MQKTLHGHVDEAVLMLCEEAFGPGDGESRLV